MDVARKQKLSSDFQAAKFILQRLPFKMPDLQAMRQTLTAKVWNHPDVRTGKDVCRAACVTAMFLAETPDPLSGNALHKITKRTLSLGLPPVHCSECSKPLPAEQIFGSDGFEITRNRRQGPVIGKWGA